MGEKEVKYIHHGSLPEIFVSLDKGLVDAGVASAPRPGFRELADLASQKIPFLQGVIVVRRAYLQAQRPIVLNFVKAFVESMKIIKERPDLIVESLAKHLRVRPEIAKEAYGSFTLPTSGKKFPTCVPSRCRRFWIYYSPKSAR